MKRGRRGKDGCGMWGLLGVLIKRTKRELKREKIGRKTKLMNGPRVVSSFHLFFFFNYFLFVFLIKCMDSCYLSYQV